MSARATTAKRVLVLAPFPPRLDAPHGAAKAIAGVLGALAERQQVGLVYLRRDDEAGADETLLAHCEFVEEVRLPRRRHGSRKASLALGLLGQQPMWVTDCLVRAFGERTAAIATSWRPHIVQTELAAMSLHALRLVPPRVSVLVEHDPPTAAKPAIAAPSPLAWPLERLDMRAWRTFERQSLPAFDAVVVFTQRDAKLVEELGARHVRIIPLAPDITSAPSEPLSNRPPTVLFFGSFRHRPNIEAARRLIEQIFPAVRRRVPSAHLEIVGERPPRELVRRAGPQVAIKGFVPDLAPHIDRAAVIAAPISHGGGMRMKVLHALASGKAVVASPLAVEGLDVQPGREVLIARDDDEFVDALCLLLLDAHRRAALAAAARKWSTRRGWPDVAAAYERLYDELVNRAARKLRASS